MSQSLYRKSVSTNGPTAFKNKRLSLRPLSSNGSGSQAATKNIANTTISIMNNSDVNVCDDVLQSWHNWIGHRVAIGGVKFGILRYFGETEFSAGLWCGVELDEPVGKNSGIVKGVQYFTCRENYGIFAPLAKTVKVPDEDFVPTKKPARSKLPSPKVKHIQSYSSGNSENSNLRNSSIRRSIVPPSGNIANNNNNPAVMNETFRKIGNETFRKIGNETFRKIENETFLKLENETLDAEQLRHTLGVGMNNNAPQESRLSGTGVHAPSGVPLSFPASKNMLQKQSDFYNQGTVYNNDYNRNITYQKVPKFDATFFCADSNLLPTSMKALPESISSNIGHGNFDSTFILDELELRPVQNETIVHERECLGSNENLPSIDFDESLGILSPSEMKDFTLSFENTFVTGVEKPPSIPKNESCDDVNDLPESEVVALDNTVILSLDHDEANLTLQNSVVKADNLEKTLNVNKSCIDQNGCAESAPIFTMVCENNSDSTNEQHQEASESDSQPTCSNIMEPGLLQTLDKTEVLEYINFSSSLNTTAALNSSFGISVVSNECDNMSAESDLVNVIENCGLSEHEVVDVSESVSLLDKPSTNKSFIVEENIKNGASLCLNDLNHVDPLPLSPITGETLPNASCDMSDPNIEPPASLSFLGATPSPVNACTFLGKNLIKFSDSPLLKSLLLDNMSKQSKIAASTPDTPEKSVVDNLLGSPSVTEKSSIHLINFSAELNDGLPTAECVPHEGSNDPFSFISQIADKSMQSEKSSVDKDKGETTHIVEPTSHLLAGENKIGIAELVIEDISNTETPKPIDNHNDWLISKEVSPEPLISVNISNSGDVNEDLFNETHCFPVPLVELEPSVPSAILVQDEALSLQPVNDAVKQNYEFDENKLNPASASTALNETVCLGPTDADEQLTMDKLEESVSNTLNLTRTFSGNKLRDLLSETTPCAAVTNSGESKNGNETRVMSSEDYLESSPSLPAKIADISAISGDGMCLEVSDVFDTEIPCFTFDKHNTSCNVPSSSKSQFKISTPAASRRQTMFVASSASKQSSQATNMVKPLKKNVVSKVKMLIEAKDTTATNQENISIRNTPSQKKPGKWDAITSKISAGLNKTKTPEIKEVASKVNTNVNAVRHSTPKTSPGRSLKNDKNRTNKSLLSSESTGAKNLRNSLSNLRDAEEKSSDKGSKESRILTQLQNVNPAKQNDGFKVPLFPVSKKKIGGSQLPSPCGSASSAVSSIPAMSKIAMAKRDVVSKVPNTSSNASKASRSIPVQQSPKVGSTLKKTASKDSSIKVGLDQKRRFSVLPRLKPSRPSLSK